MADGKKQIAIVGSGRNTFLALSVSLLLSCAASAQNSYLVKNVSVIPMNSDTVLNNHSVWIEAGKIRAIAPADRLAIPQKLKVKVIDATGKYLMPGLFDMHAHLLYEQGGHVNTTDKELKQMLANGLTTVRIMAGHPAYLEARKNVHSGKWTGPELFVASPQFAGEWPFPADFKNYELVITKQQAEEAVKKYKALGYDQIKITFKVKKDVYDAIVATAKKENIKVVGHVGPFVKLPAALAAKQQVEHMDEFIETLLPDTSYNHGESVSDYNVYSKKAWATVPFLDETKIPQLVREVKNARIYVTPTNYFFISSFGLQESVDYIRQKPDLQYIPSKLRQEKWEYRENYMKNMAPLESREKYVRLRNKMVYELWKAAVPLMAGSDSPEFFIAAGFALHDELAAMVSAGLTPFAALQTATINPANFLGIQNRTGTLETAKEADMILLDKNPLENIANTKSIIAVFTNGNGTIMLHVNLFWKRRKGLGISRKLSV